MCSIFTTVLTKELTRRKRSLILRSRVEKRRVLPHRFRVRESMRLDLFCLILLLQELSLHWVNKTQNMCERGDGLCLAILWPGSWLQWLWHPATTSTYQELQCVWPGTKEYLERHTICPRTECLSFTYPDCLPLWLFSSSDGEWKESADLTHSTLSQRHTVPGARLPDTPNGTTHSSVPYSRFAGSNAFFYSHSNSVKKMERGCLTNEETKGLGE